MSLPDFQYSLKTPMVIFGTGTLSQLPETVEKLGIVRAIVLSTPEQSSTAEMVRSLLTGKAAGVFTEATMHTPKHITDKAVAYSREQKADGVVSVGGGSTIGLGKALAERLDVPHICVPTTYAGSEMTPILGESENGRKVTRRHKKLLPTAVLYDLSLTKTLPLKLSLHSGINAIAHAVEALYTRNANPILDLLAVEGIRALSEALPAIQKDPQDTTARYKALYGSWLCGICLGNADMALHHKICHTLGGTLNLPHAETHVAVLPHAIQYNAAAAPEAMRKLASALPDGGNAGAVRGIDALYERLGINVTLRGLGMPESGIDEAVEIASQNKYPNPRPFEKAAIRELIRRAWAGEPASR